MYQYLAPTTFLSIDEALVMSPAHRVPLKQIAANLNGRHVQFIALGSITTTGAHKPRPVAFAITADALLIGVQLPLGIDGYTEQPRGPLLFKRFTDGTTAFVIPRPKVNAQGRYDFDDDVATAINSALSPDVLAAFENAPRWSRQQQEAAQADEFRASVRKWRWRIVIAMGICFAALMIYASTLPEPTYP